MQLIIEVPIWSLPRQPVGIENMLLHSYLTTMVDKMIAAVCGHLQLLENSYKYLEFMEKKPIWRCVDRGKWRLSAGVGSNWLHGRALRTWDRKNWVFLETDKVQVHYYVAS